LGAPNNTLVCFAMKEEAGPFQRLAAGKSGVSIQLTGIGRRNVERSLEEFFRRNSAQRVFTCGFAGGLDPALKSGDLLFLTVQSDLERALVESGAARATFFCSPRIAATAAEKAQLWRQTGAHAVEMESAVVHEICQQRGIPVATVRVISDTAGEDLPLDFNQLANPDQSLNYGKLAWAIAKSPGKIPALMRLQKQCRFAADRLAALLAKVIWPEPTR
jgi:adenosylhomocysteine nucleosidase